MTFVDVTVADRVTVRMELNDSGAPVTTAAFVEAMPFGGRAVHAQTSGQMFRMLDDVPIDVEPIESPVSYQWPGVVVYLPRIHEIAFAYGNARFSGATGALALTHLGTLDGDLRELIEVVEQIRRTGAVPIRFELSADQETPLSPPVHAGRKLKVSFDGVDVDATLLEDLSPVTAKALSDKLPLDVESINDTWRGQHTRLGSDGSPAGLGVAEQEASSTHLTTPGTIYYSPRADELTFAYGPNSSTLRDGAPEMLTPVIALDGDWSNVQERARAQLTDGAKSVTIALA